MRAQQWGLLTRKWVRNFGLFRFPLPDLGEKIKEGKIKKLYVKEGDRVEEF
jgi:pyruvate/2-oxoglutarate dehydrogenase complex dihydrolipoamide acyltransferase (E2) component